MWKTQLEKLDTKKKKSVVLYVWPFTLFTVLVDFWLFEKHSSGFQRIFHFWNSPNQHKLTQEMWSTLHYRSKGSTLLRSEVKQCQASWDQDTFLELLLLFWFSTEINKKELWFSERFTQPWFKKFLHWISEKSGKNTILVLCVTILITKSA